MQRWAHHGGFSFAAAFRIAGGDREGLERLLRDCARAPFALQRLESPGAYRLAYPLPKPSLDRRTKVTLTPLAVIDQLAGPLPMGQAERPD